MKKLLAIIGVLIAVIVSATPVLAVTTIPDGETRLVTFVSETAVTLNGYIIDDGGEDCEVKFQYYTGTGTWTDNDTGYVAGYATGETISVAITGLTEDAIYYYRVLIKNGAGTFTGDGVAFTPYASPTMPNRWFATPDVEHFKHAFFYGIYNLAADHLNMPRETFYFLITIFWCVVIGIVALIIGKRLVPAVIAFCGAMALASLVTLLPMFMIAFSVIGIWGAIAMGHPREE